VSPELFQANGGELDGPLSPLSGPDFYFSW
jgi:hypothetical protein